MMRVVVVVVPADDAHPWQRRSASLIVAPLPSTRDHARVCRPLRRVRSVKPRRGRDDSISNQLSSHLGRLRIRPSRDGRGVRGGREDESADGPGGPRFVYPLPFDFNSGTSEAGSISPSRRCWSPLTADGVGGGGSCRVHKHQAHGNES